MVQSPWRSSVLAASCANLSDIASLTGIAVAKRTRRRGQCLMGMISPRTGTLLDIPQTKERCYRYSLCVAKNRT